MSGRTRTKLSHRKPKFGVSHHIQYASSASSFPGSYSLTGDLISFPKQVCEFYRDQEINFAGKIEEYEAAYTRADVGCAPLESVTLSIEGFLRHAASRRLNNMLLYLSMLCACVFLLFKWGLFRRKHFSQYFFDNYTGLA